MEVKRQQLLLKRFLQIHGIRQKATEQTENKESNLLDEEMLNFDLLHLPNHFSEVGREEKSFLTQADDDEQEGSTDNVQENANKSETILDTICSSSFDNMGILSQNSTSLDNNENNEQKHMEENYRKAGDLSTVSTALADKNETLSLSIIQNPASHFQIEADEKKLHPYVIERQNTTSPSSKNENNDSHKSRVISTIDKLQISTQIDTLSKQTTPNSLCESSNVFSLSSPSPTNSSCSSQSTTVSLEKSTVQKSTSHRRNYRTVF